MAKIERIGKRNKKLPSLVSPKELTCCPKARDGLRYPCPASWFVRGSLSCKQGFLGAPSGVLEPVESVRGSVRPILG